MIEIKEINSNNFEDFYNLLAHRGAASKSFYEWKYLENPVQKFPFGFIAYDGNKPCGCMGCISRIFIDSDGNQQYATWFADWYVLPEHRGKGIGIQMQKKIFNLSDFAFGITNPKPAQLIAAKAGYRLQTNVLLVHGISKLLFLQQKKPLNGIKQYLKDLVTFVCCNSLLSNSFTLSEISSVDEIPSEFIDNDAKGVFLHNKDYYKWLFEMPSVLNRIWYICTFNTQKILFCIELSEQHNKIKVYQHNVNITTKAKYSQFLHLLSDISRQLNASRFESLDYVPFYSDSFADKFLGRLQPLQFKTNEKIDAATKVFIADKESSWENIKIKPQK